MLEVSHLVDVLCPICNQKIAGQGEVDLSLHLQAHIRETHKLQNLYDLEDESANSLHHGDTWEEYSEMVRCPFCGEMVEGDAEDDLSYNLAKHVNFDHNMKVKWMGKG